MQSFKHHLPLFPFDSTVAVGSCSGKFKSKYGAVTSPEFPGSYPRDARTCQWIVDVSENGDTTIQFPVFDIDDGDALGRFKKHIISDFNNTNNNNENL